MSLDEIIDRERKRAFGFTDDRRCLLTYGDFRRLLMEIEAAAKREEEHAIEHATNHAEAVARDNCRDCVHNPQGKNYEGGNEAAMRAAIEKAIAMIIYTVATGRTKFKPVIDVLESALSAPSRNCDILSSDQCKKMFEHEMGIYLTKEATDRDRDIVRRTAYGVIDALYAERKGDCDGK